MATVGLSMIVKNGGADLRACLQSTRSLVSQIVIADTGSTDDSKAIALEFGATVLEIPWRNDFAYARNAALEPIHTDWVLVLDADEELSAEAAWQIPALLEASEGVGGYLLPIRNYLSGLNVFFRDRLSTPNHDDHPRARNAASWAEHELCRLFRRDPAIGYQGRVHEVVEFSIREAGLRLERADTRILHFGQLADAETHRRKSQFYRELGWAKVKEEPESANGWFEVGAIELSAFNNQPVALQCLQRAIALEPRFADAWFLLFHLHDQRGEFEQADLAYRQIEHLGVAIPLEMQQWHGDYLFDRGRMEEARACYARALMQANQAEPSATEGFRAAVESKLGYVEFAMGHTQEGLTKLREAAVRVPRIVDNHQRLLRALVKMGDVAGAAEAAERALEFAQDPQPYLRAATLYLKAGKNGQARRILERGHSLFPASVEYQAASERLLA